MAVIDTNQVESIKSPAGEIPLLPDDATPEQKDAHWHRYTYQGDRMPQLTLRAVIMGGILGMLMSASNLYTTLSIGWSFGVAITSCVMSFVIWTAVRGVAGLLLMRIIAGIVGLAGIASVWVFLFPGWKQFL